MNDNIFTWPVCKWDGLSSFTPSEYRPEWPDADIRAGRIQRFGTMDALIADLFDLNNPDEDIYTEEDGEPT